MTIIYQDPHLVVVDKPSGLLSVPGRGPEKIDSVAHRIRQLFPGSPAYPAVHRLDMDTSGLLVLALTAEALRHLSHQFENRETEKRYQALLDGHLAASEGTITLSFRLDVERRPYQIYDEIHGKIGITHWKRLAHEGPFTRILFHPITGRTHQLRVHAAHPKGLGIPIVGDPLYGHGTAAGQLKLHAAELTFTHPISLKRLTFHTPVPF